EGRHQLVRLDAYVGGWEAEPPSHSIAGLDRPRHRIWAAEQTICILHMAGHQQPAHLRAVQVAAVDLEWGHDDDVVAMSAKPFGVSGPASAEREIEPDHPAAKLHHGGEPVDELLRRQG